VPPTYLQGPALLSAEYLEDAVAHGRFVWPPLGDPPPPNVTQSCRRCRRLKLSECLCSDIHGNWKRLSTREGGEEAEGGEGTAPKIDGESGWEDQMDVMDGADGHHIVEFEEDEEEDGQGGEDSIDPEVQKCAVLAQAQGLKMPTRREWPVDVNYLFDEDRGVMTVTNNPLANVESIAALNITGDLPLVNVRDNWPWVNTLGLPGSDRVVGPDAAVDNETALQVEEQRQIAFFFGDCLPGVAAAVRDRVRVEGGAACQGVVVTLGAEKGLGQVPVCCACCLRVCVQVGAAVRASFCVLSSSACTHAR